MKDLKSLLDEMKNIRFQLDGNVLILTMNRPKALNALNDQTLHELDMLFDVIQDDENIRGVILTGEGKAFVAGADIRQMQPYGSPEGRRYAERAQTVFNKIESTEKPIIAAVNGYALGGGCELAMSCDIRVASKKAVFGQPEAKLGLIPCFGGTQRLARLVGQGIAKELIYSCRSIDADTAMRIGLVNHVYDDDLLLEEAMKMMHEILKNSPLAVAYSKVAINRGCDTDIRNGLEIEKECAALAFGSKDKQEGVNAFLEKRVPNF